MKLMSKLDLRSIGFMTFEICSIQQQIQDIVPFRLTI